MRTIKKDHWSIYLHVCDGLFHRIPETLVPGSFHLPVRLQVDPCFAVPRNCGVLLRGEEWCPGLNCMLEASLVVFQGSSYINAVELHRWPVVSDSGGELACR